MANVATPSTSTDVRTTLTTEINFEDLISSQNDSNIASKADNTTGSTEKEVTTSVKASNVSPKFNLTKIAPKPTATTTKIAAVRGSSGQVVLIQGPEGNPLPIRIAGSSSNTSTTTTTPTIVATKPANTTIISTKTTGNMATKTTTTVAGTKQSPVTIQVLKMPDGSLVQIKNNKALNLTNLSNISQLNVASKIPGLPVIVKTANGPKTVFGAQTRLPPGSQILKSLTLSEAQKAGFLKPKPLENAQANKLQKILPAPSSTATTGSSTPISPTNSTVAKKEVTIKSESDGTTKQIIVPQHMLKLQSTAGPIQAIQITGKPGLQYVRVLTPGSSGASSKVVAAIKKEPNSPSKQQIIGTHRIVMNANGKPGLSFVSASGNKEAVQSTKTSAKTQVLSTVPTLRKIQDPSGSKVISILQKDSEATGTNQVAIKKISYTNAATHSINKSSSSSSQPTSSSSTSTNTNSKAQFLVVPHQVLRKIQSTDHKANNNSIATVSEETAPAKQFSTLKSVVELPDEFGMPISRKRSPTPEALRRKHCNCTKSQCLKLYCDCFANGEFCQDCNCKECFNNLEYEDERQKAIKICLERNPNAFKPKITKAKDQSDLRLHNKGCNCKRSGCLKNYCECYEAKIACSSNCKCFGCRNVEDRSERDSFEESKPAVGQGVVGRSLAYKRPHEEISERPSTSSGSASTARASDGQPPNKQPYNFITQDVVDATIQCMIAQADECHKSGMTNKTTERMIIEELGRCLVEIIDFSIRNMEN